MVKATVERKEVLEARGNVEKDNCMEVYKEEKRKIKRCTIIFENKKEVNNRFERKMNEDVDGNKNLFLKEVSKMNGGKVESCSRI